MSNLSAINHPQLLNLNDLWAEKCLERSMPSRRDFDVIEFKQWMGNLGVLDVIDGGADFYYWLLGTKIVSLYG